MIKAKAHIRYKTSEGIPCVGVTTVLSVMSKGQALVKWANDLGLQGYDSTKWRDALADVGTLIHYFVECDLKGTQPEVGDYTSNQIHTAKTAVKKWEEWRKTNKVELIDSELQVVSDSLMVGGTCDVYAKVNGKLTVLDIKTSKGCYSEHRTQVVAYAKLLEENKKQVDECRIIRIGRSENEGFDDILIGAKDLHWKRFLACLSLYRCNKDLENSGA